MSETTKLEIVSVINAISVLLLILLAIKHLIAYYQDFHTTTRRCVSHRVYPPQITRSYRYSAYFTLIAILGALICSTAIFLQPIVDGYESCKLLINMKQIVSIFKMATYCIFGLRFHILYKDSQCRVNPTILFMVSFLGSFWTLMLAIRGWSVFSTDEEKHGFIVVYQSLSKNNSNNHSFFNYCYSESPDWYLLVHASLNTILSSTYCLLFAFPIQIIMAEVKITSKIERNYDDDSTNDKTLNKSMKSLNEKHSGRPEFVRYSQPNDKQNRKMKRSDRLKQRALAKERANLLAIGMKMAILSGLLFFSTSLISIVNIFAGLIKIDILPIEMVFNSFCLVLMSPYYPDSKYFHKFCCLCIFCCDKHEYTKQKFFNNDGGDRFEKQISLTTTISLNDSNNNNHNNNNHNENKNNQNDMTRHNDVNSTATPDTMHTNNTIDRLANTDQVNCSSILIVE